MDRKQLQNELSTLSPEQIHWFVARCIIRVLPVLACRGESFPYWGDKAAKRIFAVFRACNASISAVVTREIDNSNSDTNSLGSAAYIAASQADTAVSYAVSAVAAAAEATNSCTAATATFIADTVSAAYTNAHISNAAYAAAPCAVHAAEIEAIKSGNYRQWPDLWHSAETQGFRKLKHIFLTGLGALGLEYWAEVYQNWYFGRFALEKIERCLFMPESTIKAGLSAMLDYLTAESMERFAEARVIFLGEGGAGKTSLIRSLFGEKVQPNELVTPRVEIRKRKETISGSDTLVHYWDFGGQVIMHATHQFFLREKSVYVVVLDIRRGGDLEYWLDHVRVFAAGARTLIALNKIDQLPNGMTIRPSFDLADIRRRFPFVLDAVFPMSCETGVGVDSLGSVLQEQIAASHIVKSDMPINWFQVKETLALENRDFISRQRFNEICHAYALGEEETETTLKVLDILGVAIHFPQLLQYQDVVLNPEWITKAIYEIIWASEREHCNCILDAELVKKIFLTAKLEKRLDIEVPDDKYEFLLDLMTEFKLAFKTGARGRYCSPMLAQISEPFHDLSRKECLQFLFQFPFLPPGLFYRFIAESGSELIDDMTWKTGAILAHGHNQVLVEYSEYKRTITFYAHGPTPGVYLTTLRQRLMQLMGESYKDLVFEPYIITPDGELISWREMTGRYCMEGEPTKVYTENSEYSVKKLLEEFFGDFTRDLRVILMNEFKIMGRKMMAERIKESISIEVNPTISPTINPTISPSVQNTNTVDVALNVNVDVQNLMYFAGNLEMIKEIIDDFKNDEPEDAAVHEKDLNQLCRDIERLLKDIDKVKASGITEAEKKPLFGRIKERWDSFADRAKQCYYITGMGEKVVTAGLWLAAIDWPKWLNKLPHLG